jgi:hypothetical protein
MCGRGGFAAADTLHSVNVFRGGAAGYASAHNFTVHVLNAPTKTADDLSLLVPRDRTVTLGRTKNLARSIIAARPLAADRLT